MDELEYIGKGMYGTGEERSRCLECGDTIEYGRAGKKFCCENCKNRYNNRRVRNTRISRMRVMTSLDKNYRILERLLRMGVTTMDVSYMKQLGFSFDSVTSYHKVRKRDEFCCFDISFVVTETKVTSITRVPVVLSQPDTDDAGDE